MRFRHHMEQGSGGAAMAAAGIEKEQLNDWTMRSLRHEIPSFDLSVVGEY